MLLCTITKAVACARTLDVVLQRLVEHDRSLLVLDANERTITTSVR
jgi:hypothetical protein